jgi:hypothetical protein
MRQRPLVFSVLLATVVAGCAPPAATQLEANKELIRQFTDIINAADWDALDQVVAEDLRRHSQATAGPPVTSLEEFKQLQQSFFRRGRHGGCLRDILGYANRPHG